MAESADATDLKSVGGDTVRVRPPLAPSLNCHCEPPSIGGGQSALEKIASRRLAMTFASERLTMFFTRQQLEEIEDKSLAPYGMRSKDSKGRAYLDNEPEYRTTFQRDRDRIIHTTAFRRLEYKTQVFINYEGDYFRTRLTHTLEVAQIGRTLARALGANEDLVETICLAHDLGHSPFRHDHTSDAGWDRVVGDPAGNLQVARAPSGRHRASPHDPPAGRHHGHGHDRSNRQTPEGK